MTVGQPPGGGVAAAPTAALGSADISRYAAGSFATGLFSTVPSVLLLYFATETLGIPAAIAAFIVLVPKIWIVVWDPVVGAYVDRTGRRDQVMLAGITSMTLLFAALFAPPVMHWPQSAAWLAVAYAGLSTGYSLYAVPYTAFPATVAGPRDLRSSLVSRRMMIMMVGILAGAAGAPALVSLNGGGRNGYTIMALLLSGLCAAMMVLPLPIMRLAQHHRGAAPSGFRRALATIIGNHRFTRLTLGFLLQLSAAGSLLAAMPYVVTRGFGRPESDIALGLAVLIATMFASIEGWSRLGRRIGDRRAMLACLAAVSLGCATLGGALLASVGWPLALAAIAVAGVPMAGLQVLPFTIAAHVVHDTAAASEGLLTGVWTATEKCGLAVGASIAATVISVSSAAIGEALGVYLVVGPALLCALSITFIPGSAVLTSPRM